MLRVRYGQVFGTCFLLVPRVAWLHRLVEAPGPGLTVTFLTWLVLAQGGGGTRDHTQGNFIPKNLKLPEPKLAPKPQPKASSSGEHVQLFCMVYDRKKGFQAKHL